ncbi:diguanylate cyclase [Nodularia harveyana UHCC-0300]|uniref:Diguanylate cyclase n=1 Tax=Nodularia harveyana UHCC-0300 TaxID=2974287 RepID=A0ABU5UB56_9CYAN|nr:diguanylate cyclase [Nodularia harveyana]MEA5580754.1 diguanylate cyclase [Nodularia harveyana UHCC-0300]
MKCSVLIFGNQDFLAKLPHHLLDATDIHLEVIVDLHLAISYIQTSPPDVIIAQASMDGSMKICRWLKTQPHLYWIHCIILEDRLEHLAARRQHDWDWELKTMANVLQEGADAYIWQASEITKDSISGYNNLLLAQLMLGVHKAQKHRDVVQTNNLLSGMVLADALTEMNNRRALEWELPKQIIKARTKTTPLSLIILDVDHFKRVNDTHGHLVGDRLLQLLCQRLRQNLRSQDTPFRYGGEEFVVILPQTNNQEALVVAQRLNRIIAEEAFKINHQLAINITISLGFATLQPEDDVHGLNLLHRADQYLYQAKDAGRNQVVGREYCASIPRLRIVSS